MNESEVFVVVTRKGQIAGLTFCDGSVKPTRKRIVSCGYWRIVRYETNVPHENKLGVILTELAKLVHSGEIKQIW